MWSRTTRFLAARLHEPGGNRGSVERDAGRSASSRHLGDPGGVAGAAQVRLALEPGERRDELEARLVQQIGPAARDPVQAHASSSGRGSGCRGRGGASSRTQLARSRTPESRSSRSSCVARTSAPSARARRRRSGRRAPAPPHGCRGPGAARSVGRCMSVRNGAITRSVRGRSTSSRSALTSWIASRTPAAVARAASRASIAGERSTATTWCPSSATAPRSARAGAELDHRPVGARRTRRGRRRRPRSPPRTRGRRRPRCLVRARVQARQGIDPPPGRRDAAGGPPIPSAADDPLPDPDDAASSWSLDERRLPPGRTARAAYPVVDGVPRFLAGLDEDVAQIQRVFDFEHPARGLAAS